MYCPGHKAEVDDFNWKMGVDMCGLKVKKIIFLRVNVACLQLTIVILFLKVHGKLSVGIIKLNKCFILENLLFTVHCRLIEKKLYVFYVNYKWNSEYYKTIAYKLYI